MGLHSDFDWPVRPVLCWLSLPPAPSREASSQSASWPGPSTHTPVSALLGSHLYNGMSNQGLQIKGDLIWKHLWFRETVLNLTAASSPRGSTAQPWARCCHVGLGPCKTIGSFLLSPHLRYTSPKPVWSEPISSPSLLCIPRAGAQKCLSNPNKGTAPRSRL